LLPLEISKFFESFARKKRGPGQSPSEIQQDLGSAMPRQRKPQASKDEQKMRFAAFAGRIACSAEKQDDRAEEEWKLLATFSLLR